MAEYKFKATCHTKCYWLENLWEPGEVYEGNVEPIKHFSVDGKKDPEQPPAVPGDDPRSNKEIRAILKKKFNSTKPKSWSRKKLWAALREFEAAEGQDELTNPSDGVIRPESFIAKCGFKAKTQAGMVAHERVCEKCKEA